MHILLYQIYPGDANLIVSLLDIHVSVPGGRETRDSPLEILEAGTGHGGLTLHLARAIHGANPLSPDIPPLTETSSRATDSKPGDGDKTEESASGQEAGFSASFESMHHRMDDSLNEWKRSRRAILHTIDISPQYSRRAKNVVRNFRRGLYYGNIDFHVGDVSDWITSQMVSRQEPSYRDSEVSTASAKVQPAPFLTHAFLDLPSTETYLSKVASALYPDGILMVFSPNITQIVNCVRQIKIDRLPLLLDRVVELETGRSEGRIWDVQAVRTRAMERGLEKTNSCESDVNHEAECSSQLTDSDSEHSELEARDVEQASDRGKQDDDFVMVCRPKVGERVVGGGFLGMWRKMN